MACARGVAGDAKSSDGEGIGTLGAFRYGVRVREVAEDAKSSDGEGIGTPGAFRYTAKSLGVSMRVRCFLRVAYVALLLLPGLAPGEVLTPDDFAHRMQITFSGYDRTETLTNFPALVELGPTVAALCVSPDGGDLRFTDGDGVSLLAHEVDTWDTNGTSMVWVKVPRLESGTSIWAHFGNASNTAAPGYATDGSTWGEGFSGVWHMNESNALDSTANGYDGTSGGNVDAGGIVGEAQEFPSGNNWLSLPAGPSGLADSVTVMGIAHLRAAAGAWQGIITERYAGDGNVEIELYCNNGVLAAGFYDGTWHTVVEAARFPLDRWVHVAATYDGHFLRLYRDGVQVAVSADFNLSLPVGVNGWYIGHRHDLADSWDGFLDEIRLSDVTRSSNWVWACATMMTEPAAFATYGPVTDTGDPRYWDTAADAGLQGGGGAWDATTPLWSDVPGGSDPLQAWLTGDTAAFIADGPAVLEVKGRVVTAGLRLDGADHTLSNGTVVVGAEGIAANKGAVIDATVDLDADQVWTVAAGETLAVRRRLAGGGGLTKEGDGVLSLPDFGTIRRDMTISNGVLRISGESVPMSPPPPVGGYVVWLDATDVNGDGTSPPGGAELNTWVNKAVTGGVGDFIGYASDASLPTFVDSSPHFNGLPTVRFHGNNSAAKSILYNTHDFAAPVTVLYVSRMTGAASYRLLTAQANNWLLGYHGGTRDDAYFMQWVHNSGTFVGTRACLYEALISGTNAPSRFYRDGQLLASSTVGVAGPHGLRLGGGYQDNIEHSSGEIAELLVYDRVLSDAEREAVEEYLLEKWRYDLPAPAANAVTLGVAANGTLDVNGGAHTVRSLHDAGGSGGRVTNGSPDAATLTVSSTTDATFSGTFGEGAGDGTLTLAKSGGGTLTLIGRSTHSRTSVEGGTLRLSGGDHRLATNSAVRFGVLGTLVLDGDQQVAAVDVAGGRTGTVSGGGRLMFSAVGMALGGTGAGGTKTLDMGGLSDLAYDAPKRPFSVGGRAVGVGGGWASGIMDLARTNAITASRFGVGDVGRNVSAATGNSGKVYLGQTNVIHADAIQLGSNQAYGTLQFRDGLLNPVLVVRGTSGGSSRANVTLASNSSNYTQSQGTLDLMTGVAGASTLDALVETLLIGRNGYGTTARGWFYMGGGRLEAEAIVVADSSGTGGAVGVASLDGGTIKVEDLVLGRRANGTVTSTFTLNSGTLRAVGIGPGAGAATRTFNWNGGTIANYDADADLHVGALSTFTLNTTGLVFDVAADRTATIDTGFSGSGGFRKQGTGELLLHGVNTHTGATIVAAGHLWGTGVISNSPVAVRPGAVLGPASASTPGTLALNNATLEADAGLACMLNGRTPSLDVRGALATTETNEVDLVFSGPATNGTYALIDYTNGIAGDGYLALVLARTFAGRMTAVLTNNTVSTMVELVVSDVSPPADLVWKGHVDDRWDVDATANWQTTPGGSNSTFMSGDAVRFDDTATRFNVAVADLVAPGALVVDNSTNDYHFGGEPIAGAVGLKKRGAARLTLIGNNSYSGRTEIEGGALQVGDGARTGSLGPGTVTNDASLVFSRMDDIAIVNELVGTGTVVHAGSGTLTLSYPTNSYSGGTIVSNGVLALGHGSALPSNAPVSVVDGAVFDFRGMHVGDATRNYRFTVEGAGVAGQGVVVNTGGGLGNFASVGGMTFTGDTTLGGLNRWDIGSGGLGTWLDGGGYRLTKAGPCEICIRPEMLTGIASVKINEGYIKYESFHRTNSATAAMVNYVETGGSIGSYGAYTLNMPVVMNGGVLQNHGGGAPNWMGSFLLNADTVINTSGNNGGGAMTVSGPIGGSGGITKIAPQPLYLDGSNTYAGATVVDDGYLVLRNDSALGNSPRRVPVAAGATLQLEGAAVTVSGWDVEITGLGQDNSRGGFCSWSGSNTWGGDVVLVGDSYISAQSGVLTVNGTVSGPYTLAKRLPGTIVFAGDQANTYAGTTTVHNGGGVLVLDKPAGVNAIPGDLQIGSSGAGTAWVQLGDSNQVPDSATLTFASGWGNWSYLKLMGHSETIAGFSGTGGGVLENTEADAGITNGGVLTVVHDEDYVFNGHIRDKVSGDSTGTFGLTKEGSGMLTLGRVNGNNKVNYTGPTTVNGGTVNFVNLYPRPGVGGEVTFGSSPIHIASNCTVIVNSDAALDRWRQFVAVTGSGTLIKEGSGWFQFDYASPRAFHGHIIIRAGILASAYDRTDWSGCTADVTVETNGVLDVRVDPVWIDSLDGGGEVHNSFHIAGQLDMPLTVGVANGSGEFSGTIRGTGTLTNNTPDAGRIHLVKVGAGTQILSGTNTYAGPTTVNGGVLVVNGSHTNGQAYTVNAGGTLAGRGTIHSAVNVAAAGTLAAGHAGPGTMTIGDLSLASGATNRVVLGGATVGDYAQLVVNGTVSLGASVLDVELMYRPGRSDTWCIIVNDGMDPVQGTFDGLAQGSTIRLAYGGTAREFAISYTADSETGEWTGGNDVALRPSAPSTLLIVR